MNTTTRIATRIRYIDTWETLRQTSSQARRDEILRLYWEEIDALEAEIDEEEERWFNSECYYF